MWQIYEMKVVVLTWGDLIFWTYGQGQVLGYEESSKGEKENRQNTKISAY